MGGFPWAVIGCNADPKNKDGYSTVDVKGKSVAFEMAGALFKELIILARDQTKAKDLTMHARKGAPLMKKGIVVGAAAGHLDFVRKLAAVAERVVLVSEGNFPLKRHEKKRRQAKAEMAMAKGAHSGATTVPDCAVELIRQAVADIKNVDYIQPPGEADAQIGAMLRNKQVR